MFDVLSTYPPGGRWRCRGQYMILRLICSLQYRWTGISHGYVLHLEAMVWKHFRQLEGQHSSIRRANNSFNRVSNLAVLVGYLIHCFKGINLACEVLIAWKQWWYWISVSDDTYLDISFSQPSE
ncbi:hypothetical protein XPA_009983 [Xanthoria parietina]